MPPAATQRQTLTYLKRRFLEAGIQPLTRHGQNFLIDPNLQELIVQTAELGPRDVNGTSMRVPRVSRSTGAAAMVRRPSACSPWCADEATSPAA